MNSPTKHVAAPERSLHQRMDALQRANEIRTRRAQLKRDLKGGRVSIDGLLLDAPGLPRHGEGLRPAAGGAQVRAGQGEQGAADLPHLAEQDDRRPLGAPAHRARLAPAQVSAAATQVSSAPVAQVFVITGPSGVGKGTLIRSLRERLPELELERVGHDAPAAPGRARRRRLLLPRRRGVRAPRATPASSSSTRRTPGAATGRCARSSSARTAAGDARRARDRARRRAAGAPRAARRGAGLHRAAVARGAARAARRPRHRRPRAGPGAPARPPRGSSRRRTSSRTSWSTTASRTPWAALTAIVRRALAGTRVHCEP